MKLFTRLKQRGVLHVAGAYLVVSWLLLQFADITFEELGLPPGSILTLMLILAVGFPLALSLAWIFDLTPNGVVMTSRENEEPARSHRSQTFSIVIITVLIVALGLTLWNNASDDSNANEPDHSVEAQQSIGVLPFLSLSSNDETGFFAQGLSDRILDVLAQSGILRVASRTASFQLETDKLSIQEMAGRLNVAYLMEGSVQQAGERIKVIAQLIRAHDGFHVWSKTYESDADDTFELQQSLAQNIAGIAESKLDTDVRRQHPELFAEYAGIDPRAVQFYLDGQDQYDDYIRGESGSLKQALQLMEAAVSRDPDFVAAHLDLAWNYLFRTDKSLPISEAQRRAHQSLSRAADLAPDSPDIPFYKVQVLIQLDLNYAEAEMLIQDMLREYPGGRWLQVFLAEIAGREGRERDFLDHLEQAQTIDYGNERPTFLSVLASTSAVIDRSNDAYKYADEALSLMGSGQSKRDMQLVKANALIALGKSDEAADLIELAWRESGHTNPAPFIEPYVRLGETERARGIASDVEEELGNRGDLVNGLLALGDIDRAFDVLRRGILEHDNSVLGRIRISNKLDQYRNDDRYQSLIALLETRENNTPKYTMQHQKPASE